MNIYFQSLNIIEQIIEEIYDKFLQISQKKVQKQFKHIKQYVKEQMMHLIKPSSLNQIKYQSQFGCCIIQDFHPSNQGKLQTNIQTVKTSSSLRSNEERISSIKVIKFQKNNQISIKVKGTKKTVSDQQISKPNFSNQQNSFTSNKSNSKRRRLSIGNKNRRLSIPFLNFNTSIKDNISSPQNSLKTIESDQEIDLIRKKKVVGQFMNLAGMFLRNGKKKQTKRLTFFKPKAAGIANNQSTHKYFQIVQDVQNTKDKQNQNLDYLSTKIEGKINNLIIFRNKKDVSQNNQNLMQYKTFKTMSDVSSAYNNRFVRHQKFIPQILENHTLSIPKQKLQLGVKLTILANDEQDQIKQETISKKKDKVFLSHPKRSSSMMTSNSSNKACKLKDGLPSPSSKTKKFKRNFSTSQSSLKNKNEYSDHEALEKQNKNKCFIKIEDHILYQQLVWTSMKNIENEQDLFICLNNNEFHHIIDQDIIDGYQSNFNRNKLQTQEKSRKQAKLSADMKIRSFKFSSFNQRNSTQSYLPKLKINVNTKTKLKL